MHNAERMVDYSKTLASSSQELMLLQKGKGFGTVQVSRSLHDHQVVWPFVLDNTG